MSQTYSSAIATLIATEGSHSDIPFSRLHPDNETVRTPNDDQLLTARISGPSQVVRNITSIRLVAASSTVTHGTRELGKCKKQSSRTP